MATTTTPTVKEGYVNGSDMLLMVGDKAVGHCTSHTCTFTSETKERQVKPPATNPITKALFKGKGVVGLGYNISAEGFRFFNETECGFKELFAMWKAGKSVKVACKERESNSPYLKGDCVITNLVENAPAGDDATYSIQLENDGAPDELDESKITSGSAA